MSIADKLEYLLETKNCIKTAIQNKGIDISDETSFREYATMINNIDNSIIYIIGNPVDVVLLASEWNGTTYTANLYGYAIGQNGLQIGTPLNSSTSNTQTMIESALTLAGIGDIERDDDTAGRVDVHISSVVVPNKDITIAIFGLEEVDPVPVDNKDLYWLNIPVAQATPDLSWDTYCYTAAVQWSPEITDTFVEGTIYTATITLVPKHGFTLEGIPANYFTVDGATSVSNNANEGIVTVVFPAAEVAA